MTKLVHMLSGPLIDQTVAMDDADATTAVSQGWARDLTNAGRPFDSSGVNPKAAWPVSMQAWLTKVWGPLPSGPVPVEYQIVLMLHQSNMTGGQTTANGGVTVSPADDAQAGLSQWSPNGGGVYPVGGADPNPAQARTLIAASGGGLLYPMTIDTGRVGPGYSFMKSAAAATGQPVVAIPGGVSGTSITEYLPASSPPSNWPANRYNVIKTAYDTFKAAYPNSRVYAVIASILENEINNVSPVGNIAGWLDTYVDGYRAFGGLGMDTAPFIFSSPLQEWFTTDNSKRAYLLAAAKFCVSKANCGFLRRPVGMQVSVDPIHATNAGNRTHGPQMHDRRSVTIDLQNAPSAVPGVTMTGEKMNIVSTGVPYYDIWYRAPAGSGAYTKTEFVAKEFDGVGSVMNCVAPGKGGRDVIVIARAKGGQSQPDPTAASTPHATYAVPAVTPPTPVVSLDIDNATLDGSQNIISIPSNGSDVTAWTPTAAAGQGATAALKRQLVGSKYGLILDSASKSVWRGSAYVFPAGDFSWAMPMLFTTAPGTGCFIGCGQSGSNQDIFISMANSGINLRWGHNTNAVQLLTTSNLLAFQTGNSYYRFFAGSYDRAANTVLMIFDDDIITMPGTLTQRAASPANSGGTRFFNNGLDTATAGFAGSTIALPPKVWNAKLSYNDFLAVKNQYRQDHNVSFGYTPS